LFTHGGASLLLLSASLPATSRVLRLQTRKVTNPAEFVQVHDGRAIFQESPGELPVIDIQSL
jgi:hypothetical protein